MEAYNDITNVDTAQSSMEFRLGPLAEVYDSFKLGGERALYTVLVEGVDMNERLIQMRD